MDQENDVGYFRRREAESRQMASGYRDHAIKRVHNDMADRYAAKAVALMAKPPLVLI